MHRLILRNALQAYARKEEYIKPDEKEIFSDIYWVEFQEYFP